MVERSEWIKRWVEIIAAVGVIVSLLFVGFEIRQNTAVARGQARQELAALNQEWLLTMGQDAEFEALWNKAWGADPRLEQGEPVELTPAEARRAWFIMTMHLRRLENVYLQYREGLVDASALNSYGFANVAIFRLPQFDRYWYLENSRTGFDTEFVAFLEEHIRTAPIEAQVRDELISD